MTDINNTTNLEQTNQNYRTLRPEMTLRPDPQAPQPVQPVAVQPMAQATAAVAATMCPRCGSVMDADADYCEVCHNYIRDEVCSFCGAQIGASAAFCPECGSPKVGIVCPVCRTMNEFAFCKQCGTPLTNGARAMLHELQLNPAYGEMLERARELSELDNVLPYTSEKDVECEQAVEDLRIRVLTLLANDRGEDAPVAGNAHSRRMTSEEYAARKAELISRLSDMLDRIAPQVAEPSPVKARNYAMACKPVGVRVAWVCNYKHAMHSSPCGCAKPQMGGKWIVLGKNNIEQIKDDK